MIVFKNDSNLEPYVLLRDFYLKALDSGQPNIEAVCISSYDQKNSFVDARFVNIKIIDGEDFIFFSNYESPKSKQFKSHSQITTIFYWQSVDLQIRMKCEIDRLNSKYSDEYFQNRKKEKNALAISSMQSSLICSYDDVQKNYFETLKNEDLTKRPKYWGGFSFKPYYFEFWQGHPSRINKRVIYSNDDNKWSSYIIQP